ncbi:MAG: 16S rRNA (cytosine(1402)-N(4))-methyltransferase RsmH [Propionibacteriales bacterium]|jgi:16S rRNA (cytosine1402-N4)-methyltransferase|nr:16S rRNA (cytosine(1402)-N(4))-methyltransferase RsmH [Propionibacteriales bacterium]
MSGPSHVPVLVDRVVALVAPALSRPSAVLVDATVGLGGHTSAILAACPTATVVGLDRDARALELAGERLEEFSERIVLVHAVYDEITGVLDRLGLSRVHGVLFDLGVSSMQLDEPARGFAYARDAPLDMRMDQESGVTAADLLNVASTRELSRILSRYGEERFSRRIAEAVVRDREREPFTTSGRLVELIRSAIPAAARRTGGNPAKRTFQALRIAVNDELSVLERALPAAIDALAVGGRIVVMSYQSLEDRLAKQALRTRATSAAPLDLPVVPAGYEPELRLLTRGAEGATAEENEHNPRAASVRLRAAERVREVA